MGVKITITGVEANGGKILTGGSIKGKETRIQINNLNMKSDAELLNEMGVEGENASVDIAINGATMGRGSSMLNDMQVSGELKVAASGLNVAEGATVMNGKIVGDGESVVVDLNKSQEGDGKTDKEDSPKKSEKRGLLDILFGKRGKQEKKDSGDRMKDPSIQDRVSGNGIYRDPKYSKADTGAGSKKTTDKSQTR